MRLTLALTLLLPFLPALTTATPQLPSPSLSLPTILPTTLVAIPITTAPTSPSLPTLTAAPNTTRAWTWSRQTGTTSRRRWTHWEPIPIFSKSCDCPDVKTVARPCWATDALMLTILPRSAANSKTCTPLPAGRARPLAALRRRAWSTSAREYHHYFAGNLFRRGYYTHHYDYAYAYDYGNRDGDGYRDRDGDGGGVGGADRGAGAGGEEGAVEGGSWLGVEGWTGREP
ncbi:uncharacterized protein EI97DRAFT_441083 [Westerdykella ornata]|uniref:Uncharacterized protein n=1 Tax=Westerdykella ornata TaxID=318751 RepID=A0A6A6JNH9_WESOR|nr:uncharacterized protein EI97DRAFT_441083 [Westerdykella ornata]KAF2277785.1 hypothetical protein EI97DRAFT_441083 [Westerdykella ornata]